MTETKRWHIDITDIICDGMSIPELVVASQISKSFCSAAQRQLYRTINLTTIDRPELLLRTLRERNLADGVRRIEYDYFKRRCLLRSKFQLQGNSQFESSIAARVIAPPLESSIAIMLYMCQNIRSLYLKVKDGYVIAQMLKEHPLKQLEHVEVYDNCCSGRLAKYLIELPLKSFKGGRFVLYGNENISIPDVWLFGNVAPNGWRALSKVKSFTLTPYIHRCMRLTDATNMDLKHLEKLSIHPPLQCNSGFNLMRSPLRLLNISLATLLGWADKPPCLLDILPETIELLVFTGASANESPWLIPKGYVDTEIPKLHSRKKLRRIEIHRRDPLVMPAGWVTVCIDREQNHEQEVLNWQVVVREGEPLTQPLGRHYDWLTRVGRGNELF